MRERKRNKRALDGDCVDREAGWCGFGNRDVEVGAPANALGVYPLVFVLGL